MSKEGRTFDLYDSQSSSRPAHSEAIKYDEYGTLALDAEERNSDKAQASETVEPDLSDAEQVGPEIFAEAQREAMLAERGSIANSLIEVARAAGNGVKVEMSGTDIVVGYESPTGQGTTTLPRVICRISFESNSDRIKLGQIDLQKGTYGGNETFSFKLADKVRLIEAVSDMIKNPTESSANLEKARMENRKNEIFKTARDLAVQVDAGIIVEHTLDGILVGYESPTGQGNAKLPRVICRITLNKNGSQLHEGIYGRDNKFDSTPESQTKMIDLLTRLIEDHKAMSDIRKVA